eukprot:g33392.t1
MNPWLAHYRIPKWETTSTMYGEHYRHPEQTYTRPIKNRMPVFHINLRTPPQTTWQIRACLILALLALRTHDLAHHAHDLAFSLCGAADHRRSPRVKLGCSTRIRPAEDGDMPWLLGAIYGKKLWCCYEAYLAQEEGKRILIAKNSNLPGLRCAMQRMAVAAVLGFSVGALVNLWNLPWIDRMSYVLIFTGVTGLWIENHLLRIFLNVFSVLLCCFEVTRVDRIRGESTAFEARQLRKDYQGSIQYAECARQSDAVKIHEEIDHRQDSVDYAIHVLLTAGMSTPALRYVAQAGVDIELAAYSEIAAAAVLMISFQLGSVINCILYVYMLNLRGSWYIAVLQGIGIVARFILLVLIARSHADEQCFVLKVVTKFVAVILVIGLVASVLSFWSAAVSETVWLLLTGIGWMIAFTIAKMIMSPFGLSAPNFLVAVKEASPEDRVGFAQLRPLDLEDGSDPPKKASEGALLLRFEDESSPLLLASLFVNVEARGQGIGSALVRALLERRKTEQKRRVYALTLKNKLGFFERLQFQEVSGDDLPEDLSLEVSLGRLIAPLAAGEPLIALRLEE